MNMDHDLHNYGKFEATLHIVKVIKNTNYGVCHYTFPAVGPCFLKKLLKTGGYLGSELQFFTLDYSSPAIFVSQMFSLSPVRLLTCWNAVCRQKTNEQNS